MAYLNRLAGGLRGREVAERVGVSEATVSHWRHGRRPPSPSDAVKVAKAFGRPPLEGLVAAGILTEDEAADPGVVRTGIGSFTSVEIAAELLRRAEVRASQ